ncbi:biopolymer transporter ExbD [Polyangium sp. 6x1]|uniref:ExbD/TolR family protein n=1 Tax=Polyangium sp. 6x1 TaxID=3042689 RepID=UPI00248299FF|nr:biopolymer transporter ExbD [Polyangium sp. 6x1]MDI1445368.1 biopolymer transporter ExbD [Polyangium sp. 6x1]
MGARAKSASSKKLPEPDINITPLVDVVLVLLIIFMVIAPDLEHGERVELPSVIQPDENKSKLDPITVTLTARGSLFIEKEVLADVPALEARLKSMHDAEPERRVVLKGDATVQYAKMRDAFAACQRAGYTGIALSVSQKGKGAGEES